MTTPTNALNITSAGLVKFDGTSTFSGVTTTQYDTLVGAASNGITSIATGTIGQILTSNGSGANPSYQTAPTGVFAPNAVVNLYDDFIGNSGASSIPGYLNWDYSSGGINKINVVDSGHPGILGNASTGSGSAVTLSLGVGGSVSEFILGGGILTINWIIKIATLSTGTNTYTLRIGMTDIASSGTSDATNGVYFEYSSGENSGNWITKTASASTRTTVNSSTAAATGYHNLQITINAAASSVSYTLDGVSLGSIITNIPSAAINPCFQLSATAGTVPANAVLIDLFYLTQVLTVAR